MINLISKKMIEGAVRHIVGIGAGVMVSKGWSDAETAHQIGNIAVGAVMGSIALIWSFLDKKDLVVDDTPKHISNSYPVEEILTTQPSPTGDASTFKKGFSLSQRSKRNLSKVHPDLVTVINTAIFSSPYDFTVICGTRTQEEQRALFYGNPKRSWTMKSKHLIQEDGYAHAVDLAVLTGGYDHQDLSELSAINDHIQEVAAQYGVTIKWGGHWKKVDGYHFEIVL